MGFPLGHPFILLPKLLLTFFSLLDLLRDIVSCVSRNLGLTHFMEWTAAAAPTHHQPSHHSSSTTAMRDALPLLLYRDILEAADGKLLDDGCAFCLCGFEAEEEIRQLTNCRHIFHRTCLDRWIDHDQITCPLCRTCFVPREMLGDMDSPFWAMVAADDLLFEFSFTSESQHY